MGALVARFTTAEGDLQRHTFLAVLFGAALLSETDEDGSDERDDATSLPPAAARPAKRKAARNAK
jgi:hypothetical protein